MKKGTLLKSSLMAMAISAATAHADITPKEAMIDGIDHKIKKLESMPYSPFLGDRLGYTFETFNLFDDNGSFYMGNFKVLKQNTASPVVSFDHFSVNLSEDESFKNTVMKGLKINYNQLVKEDNNLKIIQHLSNKLNEQGGIDIITSTHRTDNEIKFKNNIFLNGLLNVSTEVDVDTIVSYSLEEVTEWDINPLQYQALFDLLIKNLQSKDASIVIEDHGIVDSIIDNINQQRINDLSGKVNPAILAHIQLDRKTAAGILRIMKQQMVETAISGRNGFGPYDEISVAKMWFMQSSLDALADFVETSKPIELNSLMKEGMNLHAFFTEVMKDTDAFLQTFSIN